MGAFSVHNRMQNLLKASKLKITFEEVIPDIK
jgi:hypothetical protein